jgi:hypothetical protein
MAKRKRIERNKRTKPLVPLPGQQLLTRKQTSVFLGTSVGTVRRMEAEGTLDCVRLRRNSEVRHRLEQVQAIAAGRK